METLRGTFKENLFALRRERGMSQQEVAQKIRVSQKCISQWENGATEPTLTFLWRLADLFDTSVDVLIGRKDF
ncbi:MAG: helix-turn-helix transcriptional regulator [Clostridia bacterium]|nr:helix-turn-helix transcriptional regulator [Clostridia bacterium]